MKNLMLLLICLFMVVPSQARIITVDDDGPADFVAIQAAIDDSNDGDILVVGPGIYSKINFNGKNITVVSSNPDDPNIVAATIIDAGGTGSAVTFANGEGPDAVLTGFTITGGYGTVNAPFSDSIYWGGGIYCFGASPTIVGNIITNNEGPVVTGGVAGYGGGISCLESSATVMRNIIRDNSAFAGAGIMALAGSDRISSNLIYDNSASYGGGCLLHGSRLSNNTLVGNSALEYGGNIYAASESDAGVCSVLNNIVSGALEGGGIFYEHNSSEPGLPAYNNVWNNSGGNYIGWPDQTGINGNISEDPLFVSEGSGDYHLQAGSGCINSGDPDFAAGPGETDIDAEVRIYALRVDIGADEYVGYINPVADAGDDQYLDAIELVSLDGSGSFFYDSCGVKQFQWTQSGGPSVTLSDPCVVQPSFMPVSEAEYSFDLVVGDGLNISPPDSVLIVVGNRSPVADAGDDISCEVGGKVSLDGGGSYDPDPVDELTYSWTQVQGPSVVLYDSNSVSPYFDCAEPGTYEFELVVSDGLSQSESDTVIVAARIGSEPDAYGYRWIDSDNPYGPRYQWIDIEATGTRAPAMSDDDYVGPFSMGFDLDFYGNVYNQFYLQSNGAITFEGDYLTFGNNEIPSADGRDNMLAWMWDDLDGSGSTVYYQNFPGYSVVQFVDYNHLSGGSVNAEVIIYQSGRILFQYQDFTFDVPLGGCTIGIENADGTMGSQVIYNDPDYLHGELAIEFSLGPPYEPVADAGPDQYFDEIAFVTLDGTGSFDRDPCDVLTYYWSQVGGPSVVLSDPCVAGPTFIPDILGEYRFELVVSDGIFTSFPDDVVIAVGNRPPVAVAGPNSIYEVGTLVYLDGSGSYDPDPGDELTYFWRQLQGPNVVLEDANGPRPFFDANEEALYVFELVVSDGDLASLPDTVVVEAVILQLGRHGLLLYYKFDGSLGADLPDVITDDSGNNFQFTKYTGGAGSVTYGESNPIVAASTTSAAFVPNAGIYRLDPHPPELMDPLRLAGEQYTIELWMKPARHSSSTETATLIGRYGTAGNWDCDSWRIDIRDPFGDPRDPDEGRELRWFHKGEDLGENQVLGEDEWYHVAAVYDPRREGGENSMKLYLDGRVLDEQGRYEGNPAYDNGPVGIGCDVSSGGTIGHFFEGLIDEVRIYDTALLPCQFQLTAAEQYACCPKPEDGEQFADPCGLYLGWRAGAQADWHDVYIGTSLSEVSDADTSSSVYQGRQEHFDTFYFGPEPFVGDQTYYWRIDEVNGPNTLKGDVWSFTTAHHVIVHHEEDRFARFPAKNGLLWTWGDDEIVVGFEIERQQSKVLSRSTDGGMVWSMFDPANYAGDGDSPVPSPGGINFTHPDFAMRVSGDVFWISYDRCASWEGPYEMGIFGEPTVDSWERTSQTDYVVKGPNDCLVFMSACPEGFGSDRTFCVRTTDGGGTFQFQGWIVPPSDPNMAAMPSTVGSVCQLSSAVHRVDSITGEGRIDLYVSSDDGVTWSLQSRVGQTGIDGHSPALVRLHDGRLCCAYGNCSDARIYLRYSADRGATWGDELVLRKGWALRHDYVECKDMGYPRITQLSNGNVICAYYWSTPAHLESHIAATIWREPSRADLDGEVVNLTTGERYDLIQDAICQAADGDEIVVYPATYYGNINFYGKEVVVRSSYPTDPSVVAATVINGGHRGPVVTFESGERLSSMLRGFTIAGGAVSKGNADGDTPLPDDMGTGGGAIACFYLFRVGPVISDCVVIGNDCAGLYCYWSGPTVINCTFAGNDSNGVELQRRCLAELTNCTVVGNGAYGIFGGYPTVTNCTIVGNVLSGIASHRPRVGNCILWGNAAGDEQGQQIIDFDGSGSVTYSNVQGGWAGEGNIDTDPCFVSWGYWDADGVWTEGDYHLQPGSPCIDAADNTAIPLDRWDLDGDGNRTEPITSWDLDANPRFIDYPTVPDTGNGTAPIIDMGAYEAFLPPIKVWMKFTPQSLNPGSNGNWVKAHLVLPEGFAVDDVDANTPVEIQQLGIESYYMNVFVNNDGLVEIEAGFDRSEFCSVVRGGEVMEVTVIGFFADGRRFSGTDTVRILDKTMERLATLALHWLQSGCGAPDWCGGSDTNRDSVVNFLDFADVESCRIEVISE